MFMCVYRVLTSRAGSGFVCVCAGCSQAELVLGLCVCVQGAHKQSWFWVCVCVCRVVTSRAGSVCVYVCAGYSLGELVLGV